MMHTELTAQEMELLRKAETERIAGYCRPHNKAAILEAIQGLPLHCLTWIANDAEEHASRNPVLLLNHVKVDREYYSLQFFTDGPPPKEHMYSVQMMIHR